MSDLSAEEQSSIITEAIKAYKDGGEKEKAAILAGAQRAGQKWLTDEEFNEQFERGKQSVKERGDEELAMEFWLYGVNNEAKDEKDKKVIMPCLLAGWNPKDQEEKRMIMMGLGMTFYEKFPDHMLTTVVHTSEAWASKYEKGTDPNNPPVMPSKDPKRMEIVLVHAMSMDQRVSFYQAEILKDAKGKFTGLKDMAEDIYNPEKPIPISKSAVDRLSVYILMGHAKAKDYHKQEEVTDDAKSPK